jgi:hypothetical protein
MTGEVIVCKVYYHKGNNHKYITIPKDREDMAPGTYVRVELIEV